MIAVNEARQVIDLLADGGGRELAYVAMSRARQATHIYTTADEAATPSRTSQLTGYRSVDADGRSTLAFQPPSMPGYKRRTLTSGNGPTCRHRHPTRGPGRKGRNTSRYRHRTRPLPARLEPVDLPQPRCPPAWPAPEWRQPAGDNGIEMGM